MLKSVNLPTAVYLCVAAHYIFNLTFHKNAKDIVHFLLEMIWLKDIQCYCISHKWTQLQ